MSAPTIFSKHLKTEKEGFLFDFDQINKIIEPKIKEILNLSVNPDFKELFNYQIDSGGKRLRPALTVLSCLACGGKMEYALYPAAAIEILHNCTLIYDDIIDNSTLRRKKPTVWAKFGRSLAEVIGMTYSASIFQAANRSNDSSKISELLSKTMKEVVEGEILDILFEQGDRKDEKYVENHRYRKITQEDYHQMAGKKTASLLQACCEAGGISAGAQKLKIVSLRNYGYNIGIAFQISDDILDIFGEENTLGKKIGKDIMERKLGNIVIFYALEELKPRDKKKLLGIMRKEKIRSRDVKEGIKLIEETKAKEKAIVLGEKYVQKAKENLNDLEISKWTGVLRDLADYIMIREK